MTTMEEALRIKHSRGTLAAADYLYSQGFDYNFAMIALVGLKNANLHYATGLKTPKQKWYESAPKRPHLRLVK